uniref:SFRICE_020361 n=1 Tax=Spodoptera frugiperda TaxID=7108 RepID=A0A2H1V7S9_SPOFR
MKKCGRAVLRHEQAGSTGVIPRPHRKPTQQRTCVMPLVFQVSMGDGDCLPSGDTSARLPACYIKKAYIQKKKSAETSTGNPKIVVKVNDPVEPVPSHPENTIVVEEILRSNKPIYFLARVDGSDEDSCYYSFCMWMS